MRRRSERKKSTDVSSPAPPRRGRRSRKSPSESEVSEKNAEDSQSVEKSEYEAESSSRALSEDDRSEPTTRRRRNSNNRTPASPAKRKSQQRAASIDRNIAAIPEEENGAATNEEKEQQEQQEQEDEGPAQKLDKRITGEESTTEVIKQSPSASPYRANVEDKINTTDVLQIKAEDQENENGEQHAAQEQEEEDSISEQSKYTENTAKKPANTAKDAVVDDTEANSSQSEVAKEHSPEEADIERSGSESLYEKTPAASQKLQGNSAPANNLVEQVRTQRKRKWITKKGTESKTLPILSISTDSLKNLIAADVHPVPLSDVQLESSSEVEEVLSEREEGEETPSPEREHERERRRGSNEKAEKPASKRNHSSEAAVAAAPGGGGAGVTLVPRSPSPARNQASSVLYITNLVRPFTVLQLKGLLARTGKIVDDGFWIDRIKSKCYVQYETDDEAIETRHALHGVRWPVSNPKCLNVDFGIKADMERAIQSTKDDAPKFGQDNSKENVIVGTGWSRDRTEVDEKKSSRHVREWDVGKKESLDRDKTRSTEKRRSRERDVGSRENEKNEKDKKQRSKGREPRSKSLSPVRKIKKKENDPPLRLLDDLFRKTKATPCIYWLPLTPEQIAEKEAFRQKRIEEHKERIKQRELERGKDREKDRNRENDREKDREQRRNRSSDRRRSRSRDRRRY